MRGGVICKVPDYMIDFAGSDEERLQAVLACDCAFEERTVESRQEFQDIMKKLNLKGNVLIAYRGQNILGYSAFYANDISERIAYITLFAVNPEAQRRHIGSNLMDFTCDYAELTGHKNVDLEVRKNNDKAIAFYNYKGFSICNENESSYIMRKKYLI